MERENGQWLISNVEYCPDKDTGEQRFLPPLDNVRSMSTALEVLTSELKEGLDWAKKNHLHSKIEE